MWRGLQGVAVVLTQVPLCGQAGLFQCHGVIGTAQMGGRPWEAVLGGLGLMFVFQLPM